MDESKNIEGLHEEIASLKDQVRTLDKQLFEFKIKNQDLESAYDRLKKDLMLASSNSGTFEESLEDLKKQIADDERVIKNLTKDKSDLNGKVT